MGKELSDILDFNTAWKRMKADHPDRVFVEHPFELKLIEHDLQQWIENLAQCIAEDRYRPDPIVICDAPKGKGAVRPGAYLSIKDAVVYAALIGNCFPEIHQQLKRTQGVIDYSYILAKNADDTKWIVPEVTGWKGFQRQTLQQIDEGATHVIFADITAYYENIDISLLSSDLRSCGIVEPVRLQLSACLNRWAWCSSRGIPQGYAPSDILGKLYLHSIDDAIYDRGYSHIRYVDDYRVFCKSEQEAKRALFELSTLLRRRGLNLQTAKTEILDAETARSRIEAIASVLQEIRYRYLVALEAALEAGEPYLEDFFFQEIISDSAETSPEEAPIEVIRDAFNAHFIWPDSDTKFDKTLFHFLINRLAKDKSIFAAGYCIDLLPIHPEETRYICRYLEACGQVAVFDEELVEFFQSGHAIYPYQNYLLLEWRLADPTPPIDGLLSFVRNLTFELHSPPFLRAICRQFIGQFGSSGDLDRLVESYAHASGSLEQSEILCSLYRMETSLRNSFIRRCENDGDMQRRAVNLVKTDRLTPK